MSVVVSYMNWSPSMLVLCKELNRCYEGYRSAHFRYLLYYRSSRIYRSQEDGTQSHNDYYSLTRRTERRTHKHIHNETEAVITFSCFWWLRYFFCFRPHILSLFLICLSLIYLFNDYLIIYDCLCTININCSLQKMEDDCTLLSTSLRKKVSSKDESLCKKANFLKLGI